ncbi:MAG: type II toxin-antitoxin system HicA family toxin [Gammaproteobacteria bacterium]|nr:type II toxin-antitoxin system HicA family toxin [Gammaproteobacteria bacterium]
MNRHERLLRTILGGRSDANIRFDDLRALMRHLGFDERIRGSHHVYRKQGIPEKVNLQRDDGNAKPYQVKQLRRLALRYHLGDDE